MRIMLVDGRRIAVDPRHDLIIQRGPKVYLHFIPTEERGSDGILYAMDGKNVINQGSCDYAAMVRKTVRLYGIRFNGRIPDRALRVVLREVNQTMKEIRE